MPIIAWEQISQIEFLQPLWLLALPFVVLLVLVLKWKSPLSQENIFHFDTKRQTTAYYPALRFLLPLLSSRSLEKKKSWQSLWPLIAVLVLLFLSLSHPYLKGKQLPKQSQYRDILFLVDTEVNMLLRDYMVENQRVDRMTMLKSVLNHLVDNLQGNRMGIVLFSEQADTFVPLTYDYALLKDMVNRIEVGVTGRMSDPGRALLHTAKLIEQDAQQNDIQNNIQNKLHDKPHNSTRNDTDNNNASQVPTLVMLSAVFRPVPDVNPVVASAYINSLGLTLHTIAIGSGSEQGKEARAGTLIYQPANLELLEKMARSGGGRFFVAKSTDDLNKAIALVQEGGKQVVSSETRYTRISLFQWPIILALLVIVLVNLRPTPYAGTA